MPDKEMFLANDCIESYCTMLKEQGTHFTAGKKDSLAESSMREQRVGGTQIEM